MWSWVNSHRHWIWISATGHELSGADKVLEQMQGLRITEATPTQWALELQISESPSSFEIQCFQRKQTTIPTQIPFSGVDTRHGGGSGVRRLLVGGLGPGEVF